MAAQGWPILLLLWWLCPSLPATSGARPATPPKPLPTPPHTAPAPPTDLPDFVRCNFDRNLPSPPPADDSLRLKCNATPPQPMQPTSSGLPHSLSHILVILSFHWNPQKTVHLFATLSVVEKYDTRVDVLINTDHVPAVQALLDTWQLDLHSIRAVQGQASRHVDSWKSPFRSFVPTQGTREKHISAYRLLWGYHAPLQEAVAARNHTAFLYLEDDTLLRWPAVVSWAMDTEVLAPLGFARGIARTEFHRTTAALLLFDNTYPVNLTAARRKLDAFTAAPAAFCAVAQRYGGLSCPGRDPRQRAPCAVHRRYVQLPNPFQGMWMLTRAQVQQWMASPLWDPRIALRTMFPEIERLPPYFHPRYWGLPERSNAVPLAVAVPAGFGANNVVPYHLSPDGRAAWLSPLALVEHSRNARALAKAAAFAFF
eukprot:EG_transcript_10233